MTPPPPQLPLALCLLQRSCNRLLCVTSHRQLRRAYYRIWRFPLSELLICSDGKRVLSRKNNHFDTKGGGALEDAAKSSNNENPKYRSVSRQCALITSAQTWRHCRFWSRIALRDSGELIRSAIWTIWTIITCAFVYICTWMANFLLFISENVTFNVITVK